jgi:hypothetical protein
MQVNQPCGTVPSTTIERDLFGAVRLVRNWERIGTRGQELVEIHAGAPIGTIAWKTLYETVNTALGLP